MKISRSTVSYQSVSYGSSKDGAHCVRQCYSTVGNSYKAHIEAKLQIGKHGSRYIEHQVNKQARQTKQTNNNKGKGTGDFEQSSTTRFQNVHTVCKHDIQTSEPMEYPAYLALHRRSVYPKKQQQNLPSISCHNQTILMNHIKFLTRRYT